MSVYFHYSLELYCEPDIGFILCAFHCGNSLGINQLTNIATYRVAIAAKNTYLYVCHLEEETAMEVEEVVG